MRGRLGVEVELLAPPGSTRRDLAEALAGQAGGSVEPFLFPDAEPSKVEGAVLFHNLTPGFRVRDVDGDVVAWLVDDITLQADLVHDAPPLDGWWRLVSDDRRLTALAARFVDAAADLPDALGALAELFEAVTEAGPGGMWRLRTHDGQPIVIGAPLPGDRHRTAELVTAPIGDDHRRRLDDLLGVAVDLGFTAPVEGATHVHLDAGPLRDARTFRRLVEVLAPRLPALREVFGTNPGCVRLGPWPAELLERVAAPDWDGLGWEEARARLADLHLTKYCDLNLRNVVLGARGKETLEIRTLPVHLDADPIVGAAELVEEVVAWASGPDDRPEPTALAGIGDVPRDGSSPDTMGP